MMEEYLHPSPSSGRFNHIDINIYHDINVNIGVNLDIDILN